MTTPSRAHYVYAYYTKQGPFYFGVGTNARFLSHLAKAANPFLRKKLEKLSRLDEMIGIKIVYETDNRAEANQKEIELIAKYGRRDEGGCLCNLAPGGDGGDTYTGRRLFYNPKTKKIKAFKVSEAPNGWLPGRGEYAGPRIACYNPKTLSVTKVYTEEEIPEGFVRGLPKGLKTGPTGKWVIANPKTGEHQWIEPRNGIPKGWVRGRIHKGSTEGKVRWTNLETRKARFIRQGEKLPNPWVQGSPNAQGKAVVVKGTVYPSVAAAAKGLDLTRHKFCTTVKFRYVDNR